MKTIYCVFVALDATQEQLEQAKAGKSYSYLTNEEIKPFDLLSSPLYKKNLLVVAQTTETKKYVNLITGAFKDNPDHPKDFRIKEIKIGKAKDIIDLNVVWCEKL